MPFDRFPGADTQLGPEMKSTGEVMGVAEASRRRSQSRCRRRLPLPTRARFLSVRDADKPAATILARRAHARVHHLPRSTPPRIAASACPSTW